MGDKRIVAGPEVAILFDQASEMVLKHGAPELVHPEADTTRARLKEEGFERLANDLVCITGAFDLEELNKVVSCTNYIGVFYKKLMSTEKAA
ncbi:hypothetical protein WJ96_03965 [Burkholderia ubonensis]|uniref:Uncharacterized protein n=1 Tax=Burkholderia ubonensis TaxID=101571 RepID=A0AAW3MWX6_9BURK|nr:hypothetical protein WJ93_23710 [Burkholderia ubonensis]KVP96386.1 hypothetical protein WJ97_10880 [Burkholderia ubonensis]KVP97731.1 hypothetical protein WJ96_03965 [Burkholderia ubonensis]KVZ92428.1 hypothetical protein WL25_15620 [Burkholderia ubonensis]